jgi:hypothetical protein
MMECGFNHQMVPLLGFDKGAITMDLDDVQGLPFSTTECVFMSIPVLAVLSTRRRIPPQ